MNIRPVRNGRRHRAAAVCVAALLLCVAVAAIHSAAPHGGQRSCQACHQLTARFLCPPPVLAAVPVTTGDPLPVERSAGRTADTARGLSPLRAPPRLHCA